MPIIELQRRLAEIGRIRIGQQLTASNGKSRPAKLDTFRLTSPDRRRIHEAAKLYGGTPQEWQAPAGKQWELITEADYLNVVVPPSDMAFTQYYELWSAGGCQRRCDGTTESISDGLCICDPDKRECAIHTRLSVMLRDLAGIGVWRLDTQGYYAAVELQGAVEVVQLAAGRGQMLPAVLRLEQRMVKRGGQTRRFAVPVLDIEVSPAQLLGTHRDPLNADTVTIEPPNQQLRGALTPVPDTVLERPEVSIAEQAITSTARKPRRNAQQTIPATGLAPRTAAQVAKSAAAPPEVPQAKLIDGPTDDQHDEPVTRPQLQKLSILRQRERYADTDEGRTDWFRWVESNIARLVGSNKELTKAEASVLIDILENVETPA